MIRPVLAAWALTRVLYLAAAEWSARRVAAGDAPVRYPAHHFWDTLVAWDGLRYLDVAAVLYPRTLAEQHGFFPLLPLLLRGLDEVGIPPVAGGLVLANAAGLAGLIAVVAVTRHLFDETVATRTGIALACFPLSYVFSMLYSEPFALAAGFGAVALVQRGRYWAAVPLGIAVGLSRSSGVLFALPLAAAALRAGGPVVGRLFAVAAPAIGLGAFAAYLQARTGSALAFQEAQRKFWFRRSPGFAAARALINRISLQKDFVASLSPYLTVGYLAAILGVARRVPVEWTVFALLTILLPLSTGRYAGVARYGLLALPVFWALAFIGGRYPRLWRVYRVVGPAVGELQVVWWLPGHTP
ncbi:MAG: hypothetical protein QOJ34_2719 [Pseudonocardiales bacterium]|nr:hypothetical protein [Pseudonocardiales bacterium]